MSSPDEVSVWGTDLGPEGGEQGGVHGGPTLGLDVGAPQSGESEDGLLVLEGLEAKREVMEAAGAELWGPEGRLGSPADEKEDGLNYTPHLAEETAAIAKQLTDRDPLGFRRNLSPKSGALQMSSIWADLDQSARGRCAPSPSCEELQQVSPGGRSWGKPRRGLKSKLNIPEDLLRPLTEGMAAIPSDPESSDEFSEIQTLKVNIYTKGGGQAMSSSLEDPGDIPRHLNPQVRENIFHMPSSFQASISRGLVLATQRQPVGELELSSSKKMHSMVSAKRGSRLSHPGAATAAGSLPHATPKKKVAQEKQSSSGASKVALGRKSQALPTWGQRVSAGSLTPATFPPISGLPMLGRSKRYSLAHLGTKQPKHSNAGKKPVACRPRESESVAGEDNDPSRDPVRRGQLPSAWPELPCSPMHRGEFSGGDAKTRAPQVPGSSQALALSHGGISPRGSAASGLSAYPSALLQERECSWL
ncbi:uncharacterized protein CXorf49 homolog [Dasypus novemcinctus]|uniref:uncharacterized protein CXorf49 homolog n=1 Tax=Dasypus novemcinctus TaxID=9361 RepID=UPI0026604E42|nr:uncharacterized protein CXorf49 homolog [Dasypus novemcinctus]